MPADTHPLRDPDTDVLAAVWELTTDAGTGLDTACTNDDDVAEHLNRAVGDVRFDVGFLTEQGYLDHGAAVSSSPEISDIRLTRAGLLEVAWAERGGLWDLDRTKVARAIVAAAGNTPFDSLDAPGVPPRVRTAVLRDFAARGLIFTTGPHDGSGTHLVVSHTEALTELAGAPQ